MNRSIDRNNLTTGTVLQLNGYDDNTYCIVDKSVSSWDGSVIYETICIETKTRGRHESRTLIHISEKTSNEIQLYITDEILFPSMVEILIKEANEKAIADAKAKEVAELVSQQRKEQYRKDFPYLIPTSEGGKVNKNIKKHLQTIFKGVKFSVKDDHCNSSKITWTNGPTVGMVEEITDLYKAGSFDGMTDCYNFCRSDWHIFGSVQYLFVRREISEDKIQPLLPAIKSAMVTAEEYYKSGDENSLASIDNTGYCLQYTGYYYRLWSDTFICEASEAERIAKAIFRDTSF